MSTNPNKNTPTQDELIERILRVIRNFDITVQPSWEQVKELSSDTVLEGLEVEPAGIVVDGNKFEGVANVHVLLHYSADGGNPFNDAESLVGHFRGHLRKDKTPVIDEVQFDLEPFYENPAAE
jgi:hypothetical protein